MVQENQRDWFEEWLMIHPDELEKLQKKLGHLDLDYTPESLLRVEAWVLENYSSPDEILKDEEKMTLDGLLRYVGEVFKIHLQGRWISIRIGSGASVLQPAGDQFSGQHSGYFPAVAHHGQP